MRTSMVLVFDVAYGFRPDFGGRIEPGKKKTINFQKDLLGT